MLPADALLSRLRDNVQRIHERIRAACARAGRDASEVQLVAVTKSAPMELVALLPDLGLRVFGENRPQQLLSRAGQLSELCSTPVEWHLIGQLQSNKVRSVLPATCLIHSVDSLGLMQRISRIAGELDLKPSVLIQVNISGEESKSGFEPETLRREWNDLVSLPNVRPIGLMTMAPFTDEEPVIRRTFAGLRQLRQELQQQSPEIPFSELSMGMSHDFEIAIEEGATIVRIGSSLFEGCIET